MSCLRAAQFVPRRAIQCSGWSLVGVGVRLLCWIVLVLPVAVSAQREHPIQEASIHIARLHYGGGGDWYSNPSSLPNWLRQFQQRTGMVTFHEEMIVRPNDNDLYRYPLVYMNGHGTVKFSEEEAKRLRTWMQSGGFLWADDNYGMDDSFRREVRKIFPDRKLVELPNDHPLYHCFYDLPGLPKVHEHENKAPQALVIKHENRIVLLYTFESDIGDGIEDPDVHKDSPEVRENAMRMATNILMYALTH